MKFIKSKIFILNYVGSLLFILATFLPIIKINNQSYAFIDEFLNLSIVIAVLSTATIIITTLKKYRFTLIPIVLNIATVICGIFKILNIENLKMFIKLSYASFGIALIIYIIAIIISLAGGILLLLTTIDRKKDKKLDKKKEDQLIEQIFDEENNIDENNETYVEQIPIESISTDNTSTENNDEQISEQSEPEQININIDENNLTNEGILFDSEVNSEVITYNLENNIVPENKIEDNEVNNITNIDNIISNTNETPTVNQNSDDSMELKNISMTNFDDEIIEENQIETSLENGENTTNNLEIDDEFIEFEEINEEPKIPTNIFTDNITSNNEVINTISNNEITEITEIPDIINNDENLMINNTQVQDAPKEEFMALNPSDIKISEKRPLFKHKEEKAEDPLAKIMNRNIPMTLERKCQFCDTPLGDDERICPLCGRIN